MKAIVWAAGIGAIVAQAPQHSERSVKEELSWKTYDQIREQIRPLRNEWCFDPRHTDDPKVPRPRWMATFWEGRLRAAKEDKPVFYIKPYYAGFSNLLGAT